MQKYIGREYTETKETILYTQTHVYHNIVTDTRAINKPIMLFQEQHSESNKSSNIVYC